MDHGGWLGRLSAETFFLYVTWAGRFHSWGWNDNQDIGNQLMVETIKYTFSVFCSLGMVLIICHPFLVKLGIVHYRVYSHINGKLDSNICLGP